MSQKEAHLICARSLLGKIEADTGGLFYANKSIDSAGLATRATLSSSRVTTMAVVSEVCLVVISQDTSLETVLWIHLLLRTLSWCKVWPQLLDGNDGGDCVKSSSDAGVRTLFDFFFASVTCLAVLFPVMSTHTEPHMDIRFAFL